MNLFHASLQWSTMSPWDLNTRFDSPLFRMNPQMVPAGLSFGHFGGSGKNGEFGGKVELVGHMPAGLIEERHGMHAGDDIFSAISASAGSSHKCRIWVRRWPRPCHPWAKSPKMYVDALRWSVRFGNPSESSSERGLV